MADPYGLSASGGTNAGKVAPANSTTSSPFDFNLLGFGLGSVAGGALGDLYNLFFGKDPYEEAAKYINQIPNTISPYYSPYVNAGSNTIGNYTGVSNQLMTNPTGYLSSLGSQFTTSPGYQFNYQQALNAANQAASAGGMLGTSQHQQQASTIASNLASQEYNNYINQAMGILNRGMTGGSDISRLGYSSANELASSLADVLKMQAGLGYGGANYGNTQTSNLFSDIGGALGGLFL